MQHTSTADKGLLARAVRQKARELGFTGVGFVPATPLVQAGNRLAEWLAAGRHAGMAYLARDGRLRAHPERLLAGAKTVIACATTYAALDGIDAGGGEPAGRIARYARGRDYHRILGERLRSLAAWLAQEVSGSQPSAEVAYRDCVDSTPLMERAFAEAAGLGFVGKNTLVITPGTGSYTLLGELLTTVEIREPQISVGPTVPTGCGRCTACKDVCPTGALVEDRILDAGRCISYLTIELDGPIPRPLRPLIGDWIFGCDLCQEVCPFNASASAASVIDELGARRLPGRLALRPLLAMSKTDHKKLVKGTALRRVRRRQLLRNVAVALGNVGTINDVDVLLGCAANRDEEPLVRGHAVWAAHRLGASANDLLRLLRPDENAFVVEEIRATAADSSGLP